MVIETQHWTEVLHICVFLHNSTILNLALVNGRCPSGGPLLHPKGVVVERIGSGVSSSKEINPLAPEKE